MYDIAIIGGGPAGLTAAIYARRAEKKVVVIERAAFGGQMSNSPKIENFPGTVSASGTEIADKMVEHALELGADLELAEVTAIENGAESKKIITDCGDFEAKAVIIANGVKHRMLGLDGEEELVGNGISFCAVCDGAFYKGKKVAVIGGGNSALQEAVLLSDGCEQVTVVQNLAFLTGEEKLISTLKSKSNVNFIYNTIVEGFLTENGFNGLKLLNTETKEQTELACDGVFVAIGLIPENDIFADFAKLDERGYFESDENCLTSTDGVFVAGDCRSKRIRQVATAVADGAVAALAACRYLDQ